MTDNAAQLHAVRSQRVAAHLKEAGHDAVLLYGNAWQGDYLRFATGFGCIEGHALALVHADGTVRLYVESPEEAERAAVDCPWLDVSWSPDVLAEVDAALARLGNARVGVAPRGLMPYRFAARPLTDATAGFDSIMMRMGQAEQDAVRRAAAMADRGYQVFMQAARVGRAEYELIADIEAFFRGQGCPDNFQIIGSGGVEVRGMHPPGDRRIRAGDLVTTELTPCVDGYYAQICRTLVVGQPNEAQRRAFALFKDSFDAGFAAVRAGATAADVARAENDVFRKQGLGKYTTSEYTRVRGHGLGLFPDSKPQLLEDVTTPLVSGMALVVHPNTYHPEVGYMVFGDTVIVTDDGAEAITRTPRELFAVPG
jgi:Xaa-Pro aminopeptidase